MTTGANSLTDRARSARGVTSPSWTASGSDLRVLITALADLGYDTRALLAAAGLDAVDLRDPDVRISCDACGHVIGHAQQTHFTPNLGLEVARRTPLGAYPLLDYLVVTSDTVGNAVQNLARYFRLAGNPVTLTAVDRGDHVRVEMTGGPAAFTIDYVASLMVLHLGRETEGPFAVVGVNVRHEPDDVRALEEVLGCPIRASAEWDGLTFTKDVWNLPLRRRDPILRGVLESHADATLSRLPSTTGFAAQVARVLAGKPIGDARMSTVARELGMSARTLQRRLADGGTSYQAVQDDVRREAAGRYLADSEFAISEVAYLVGFSEAAPFHRAFKRWYGVTPDAFRRSRRTRQALNLSGPK
jgi:AraC-like DNA-binding protein